MHAKRQVLACWCLFYCPKFAFSAGNLYQLSRCFLIDCYSVAFQSSSSLIQRIIQFIAKLYPTIIAYDI